MSEEQKTEEKKFDAKKDVLIEGCISSKARETISQMLERRLAELDPQGLQAQFIIKLQNELSGMTDCEKVLGANEKEETKE